MSLAALIGLDARVLLTTDDPATHNVYDRVIEQARTWAIERDSGKGRNAAIHIGNVLVEIFGRKRGS